MILRPLPIALLCTLVLSGTPAFAEPALWRVSDGDSSVHLFGSIHMLVPGVEWRTPKFEGTLAAADYVYFEVDMTAEGMATAAEFVTTHGVFPPGESIADVLTDEEHERLLAFLANAGIPVATIEATKPWLLEFSLGFMQGGDSGGVDENVLPGVDMILSGEVPEDRQRPLETLEEQLASLYDRPMEDQVAALMATISSEVPMAPIDAIGPLLDAWVTGNSTALDQTMNAYLGGPGSYHYDEMLTKRNLRWTDKIEGLLADNTDALIVAGAGHFVGSTSVTALLEGRGYTVELISEPFAPTVNQHGQRGQLPMPVTRP